MPVDDKTLLKAARLSCKKKSNNDIIEDLKIEKSWGLSGPFYRIRSILGNNNWAMFYILVGARDTGKSYGVTEFFLNQYKYKNIPFNWIRLSEISKRKLLQNNALNLIDPDLRVKYNVETITNGSNVYEVVKRGPKQKDGKLGKIIQKKLMCRCFDASTFYNDKGSGLFDKNFLEDPAMFYNIAVDEMNREANEKNTFDIVYSLANSLETLVRDTKKRIRVFFIGNLLSDASDILAAFNFIPEKFGRYKLKSKRCVIDYIPNTETYIERRKGSVADILLGSDSTFTNKRDADYSLINKTRPRSPSLIIKFFKDTDKWFTLWDNSIIKQYNKETIKEVVSMRPYLDGFFNTERQKQVIDIFDARGFQFDTFITFKKFEKELQILKPRKH